MFNRSKLHERVKGNRSNVKVVKRFGATVSFRLEPHPNALDSIMYAVIEIKGVGIMTTSFVHKDWSFSNGMPKIDYGKRAASVIGAACALATLRDDRDVEATVDILHASVPDVSRDKLKNELLLVSAMQIGIVLQPQTGYSTKGMAASAGIEVRDMRAASPVAGSPFPPSPEPPKPEQASEADKKKTLH